MVLTRHRRLWRRRLRRRPLLVPLVLASVTADVALAPSLRSAVITSEPVWSAAYGFVMAQLGLVAIWLVGGSGGIAWRLLVSFGACMAFGWVIDARRVTSEMSLYGVAWLAVAAAASAPSWWVARRQGLRRVGSRWTIASLIGWTTVGAIIAATSNAAEGSRWVDWNIVWSMLTGAATIIEMVIDALLVGVAWGIARFARRLPTASALLLGAAIKSVALRLLVAALSGVEILAALGSVTTYVAAMTFTLGVWLLGLRVRRSSRPLRKPSRNPWKGDDTNNAADETSDDARDESPATLPMRIDVEG